MHSAELRTGRVFVLRLEDGEHLRNIVEDFCKGHGIVRATVTAVGGVAAGSEFIVGPTVPLVEGGMIIPLAQTISEPHELVGTGTVFPDAEGNPVMHMHGSVGRDGYSSTGCFRENIVVWLVMEVVITELIGDGPVRLDSAEHSGMRLLEIR